MSAILSADDLNDFILPGLACVKPVQALGPVKEDDDEIEIQVDIQGNAVEISRGSNGESSTAQLDAAQISLADCLACLGCVTSAEEVLVAQHSHMELLNALEARQKSAVFVASVCHQTRSSLAAAYGKSIQQVDYALLDLFVNQMGFKYVVGTGLGRKISLYNEATTALQMKLSGDILGPVMSSICPGWVLYAEKTHPHVLGNLSNVKLAQQITGCILKTLAAKETASKSTKDIYHLSVMPCFDKKLESARKEADSTSSDLNMDMDIDGQEKVDLAGADVDCVLTAKELVSLVEEKYQWRWSSNGDKQLPHLADLYKEVAPTEWPEPELSWLNDPGSASGGYAENYLATAQEKYQRQLAGVPFSRKYVPGKNADLLEIRLVRDDTQEVMTKVAVVNGFRNIQNLVRKLKDGGEKKKKNPLVARRRARKAASSGTESETKKETDVADPYLCDYVEVMACPGGCINGGGQISAPEDIPSKNWGEQVVSKYVQIPVGVSREDLQRWTTIFCQENGIELSRLIETWFKEVEKSTDPNAALFGAKW